MVFDPNARLSNAVGDLVLGLMHARYLYKALEARPRCGQARLIRALVAGYFFTLGAFQLLGAWCHLYDPAPSELSRTWLVYLAMGVSAPSIYGSALTLDQFGPQYRWVASLWLFFAGAYVYVASLAIDLAFYLPFPRAFSVTFPPFVAECMAGLVWMPEALVTNGQKLAGEAPLTLHFDGRGYASIPFRLAFDTESAHSFDLIAPFPCWRTHSLTVLMLVVGTLLNTTHLSICIKSARHSKSSPVDQRRRSRASRCQISHALIAFALVSMPAAMLLHGVSGGIDWMHACAAPGMYLQCVACLESVVDADLHPETTNGTNGHAKKRA